MYIIENAILSNSITVAVGDVVIINSSAPKFVTPNGTNVTLAVLGTVRAIKNGPSKGNTYLQVNSITTASDNQTVAQISVDILPSDAPTTYTADLDAAAGTTTNSQYFGYFAMVSGNAALLDESTYSATTPKQFLSYGLAKGSTTQVVGIWSEVGRA